MTELAINAFILLFVVIDPISLAPLFSAMTRSATDSYRRKTAFKGVIIAGIILVIFTLLGDILLDYLNIEPASFSIAGGILLFLIAIDMLFVHQSGLRSTTVSEQAEAEYKDDISVFPLAIPLIAGPGAFTTLLLLTDKPAFSLETCVILLMLLLVLFITFFMLFIASRITGFLGETGTNVITRVLGIILAALAVQFIVDGMITSFPFLKSG
jgi:multiple antibiotic resistance protein